MGLETKVVTNSEQLSSESLAVNTMVEQILDDHMRNIYSETLLGDSPYANRYFKL